MVVSDINSMRTKKGNADRLIALIDSCTSVFERATSDIDESKLAGSRLDNALDFRIIMIESLTIAKYSVGADIATFKSSVLNFIKAFEEGFKWEGFSESYGMYDQMVWLVSMAILVDVNQKDFERITKVLARDKVNDRLLNFLINHRQPNWKEDSNQFIQKHPYKQLSHVLDESNGENGIRLLQSYLTKKVWYSGHSDSAWYDTHERSPNNYFGYWSWEAAALVKAKGWDDGILKDNEYYPYDALHY